MYFATKMLRNSFKIYDASAGSGKTYTLTKEYIKIVLSSPRRFGKILAITFTNKAVNEMKNRILDGLHNFAGTFDTAQASSLFLDVMQDLDWDMETLRKRSSITLKDILHNYAFFDISTIDKFTHRLIRTFARDLRLPQNFEVVLDVDILLEEAIDRLIGKAGTDYRLTQTLIEFALEKIDDNKSWDIAFDLRKIGILLFDETHSAHIQNLQNKSPEDFILLKKNLLSQIRSLETQAAQQAEEILGVIADSDLEEEDFPRQTLPNHFKKIRALEFDLLRLYNNKLEDNLMEAKILKSGMELPSEEFVGDLLSGYRSIKNILYQRALLKNVYGNIVPLTLMGAIAKEIKDIQEERDQLSISDFNAIISREIKNQPAPYIYERLGEKYFHYFIDEFQDTSEMQWNNLVPLLDNALASDQGSLFLVGDAKQAIYRWRGGQAEQFLNLINLSSNPFVVPPRIESLPKNYRSFDEVVTFNNSFFKHTSPFLNRQLYNDLFEKGSDQKHNAQRGGLVQISFLERGEDQDNDLLYCEKVLGQIQHLLAKKYSFGDICILTRKRKHGVLLADFLMRQNIPIISSETLLLAANPKVEFLIDLLGYSIQPDHLEKAFKILSFLGDDGGTKHSFIQRYLENPKTLFRKNYDFDLNQLNRSTVYDALEYAIRQFNLANNEDAYLMGLLDFALEAEQKEEGSITAFLSYWEKKKKKLSITVPADFNAVQIMTIHKAKGLEFPIVIFPYANSYIYEEVDPKLWLPVEKDGFNGFTEVLINKKREVAQYNETANSLFMEEQHKLELDAFNMLYVALTRAVKGLFIISEMDLTSKGDPKTDRYSGLFIHYLMEKAIWQEDHFAYDFGSLPLNNAKKVARHLQGSVPYTYSHKDRAAFRVLAKSGMLWDTEREAALIRGNLIHYILGHLITHKDLDVVFERLIQKGDIDVTEAKSLKDSVGQVIFHPELEQFYKEGNLVKNEKEMLTRAGQVLRPDRLVLKGNKVTLIDYKTGKREAKYHDQLYTYADTLAHMGYFVENKIIVYIDKEVTAEFI